MKILVSWIGHADLKVLVESENSAVVDYVRSIAGGTHADSEVKGPIMTLLQQETFDKVYLLSTYPQNVTQEYLRKLPIKAEVTYSTLDNPTDYSHVFIEADSFLRVVTGRHSAKESELSILLSPGTPAMAAIWVLLGKTKYPAVFWQTWKGVAKVEDIPFDITVDVVSEILHRQSIIFDELSSKGPKDVQGFEDIIGESQAVRLAVGRARKAALFDVPVLLTGESGTGKEMFARAIHKSSHRREKPFVSINCAAMPSELLESELFGHAKGAFTGAVKSRQGAFKRADGGTLFLDEIGECTPEFQAKLLRVLQPLPGKDLGCREFSPVGADSPEMCNIRILAATNRDLFAMVGRQTFREDLFYRIAVINLRLPPLRERRADIPLLSKAILAEINSNLAKQDRSYVHKKFYSETINFIKKLNWPGNVRELYNVILQVVVMSCGSEITPEEIKAALAERPAGNDIADPMNYELGDGFDIKNILNSIHAHYLRKALKESGGNKTKAASLLGLKSYQALVEQMKRLDIALD